QARDEDDGTATAAHQLEGLTAAQESAAQPGVDLAVPNVSGHAGEWALDQDLGAVDQGVERLQLPKCSDNVLLVGHVRAFAPAQRCDLPATGLELADHLAPDASRSARHHRVQRHRAVSKRAFSYRTSAGPSPRRRRALKDTVARSRARHLRTASVRSPTSSGSARKPLTPSSTTSGTAPRR